MTSSPFGTLLRAHRLGAGLTQSELAERADMSPGAITALECGVRRAPYRETVAALSNALSVTPGDAEKLESIASRARARKRETKPAPQAPGNLPLPSTSFVGRAELLLDAEAILRERRVVALTGRGGIGKTRAALVLAERVRAPFIDGAWLVDLSAAVDEPTVVAKIALTIGATLRGSDDSATIARLLASRRLLLVFDNCERAVDACAAVITAIRSACPTIAIVATSTVAIPGTHATAVTELRTGDAIELFIARCEQFGCRVDARTEMIPIVAAICRRLEGVPLAIELAASRARGFGLAALDVTIARWFDCTRATFSDVPVRHQSLCATIAWSHALLDEGERIVFSRLAVFEGGFDLAAAEAVCATQPQARASVRRRLFSLADRSFVSIDGNGRFSLFDSLRAFAERKLRESHEYDEMRRRHASYFASFVGEGTKRYYGSAGHGWLAANRTEEANIEAALACCSSDESAIDIEVRLTAHRRMYLLQSGRSRECRRRADALLARIGTRHDPRLMAELYLSRAGNLKGSLAVEAIELAIACYRSCADAFGLLIAGCMLAEALSATGDGAAALAALDAAECATGAERAVTFEAYPRLAPSLHLRRGRIFVDRGQLVEARAEFSRARELAHARADSFFARRADLALAEIEFALGNLELAEERGSRLLRDYPSAGDEHVEFYAWTNLAAYRIARGEIDGAFAAMARAFALACTDSYAVASLVQHAATALAVRTRSEPAARLLGHVDAFFMRMNCRRSTTEEREYGRLTVALQRQLSQAEIARFAAEGAALDELAAVALAEREIEMCGAR